MTFEEYVGSRGPALIRLARLLTGDEHRAEDLTQEVLSRAYVHWRKISRADRPDVYVRRMLINAYAVMLHVNSSEREKGMVVELQYAATTSVQATANRTIGGRPGRFDPGRDRLELLDIPQAVLSATIYDSEATFSEAEAGTVLTRAQVAEHLDRPDTW